MKSRKTEKIKVLYLLKFNHLIIENIWDIAIINVIRKFNIILNIITNDVEF